MGFLVLTVVGGILGWLISIVLKFSERRRIAINVGAGVAGSLMIGYSANGSGPLNGITAVAFLLGCIGAVALIALTNFVRDELLG